VTADTTTPAATTHTRAVPGLWATVAALAAWLDASNGTSDHEQAMRLMKLSEETGEVAQAYIGMTGQNPRKGITHSRNDVADELCDVIVTAMVALHAYTPDPARHLTAKLQRIADRAHLHCTCDDVGHGPCPAHLNPDYADGRLT
jgi:NTP pyrophosphatase (non-canonical NTP hydrolase)